MGQTSSKSPLGERLKRALKEAGISVKEASARIGVPERAFYNWTMGLREPKIEILEKIAKEFQINPSYLLTGQGSPLIKGFEADIIGIRKKKLPKKSFLRSVSASS